MFKRRTGNVIMMGVNLVVLGLLMGDCGVTDVQRGLPEYGRDQMEWQIGSE